MRPSVGRRPGWRRHLTIALLSSACLAPAAALATNFDVANEAQLRAALNPSGGAQNGDTITFTTTITVTAAGGGDLPIVQRNVTIVGNNNTLSGNGEVRGLFVGAFSGSAQAPVTVTIQDLTIDDTRAQGGAGGTGFKGGGGGAGLGGALFVADQANVTLSNVTLSNNDASGGAGGTGGGGNGGGGGGMGGSGGPAPATRGGGGGLGSTADGGALGGNGSDGIALGASSGGSGASGGTGGLNGGGGGSGGSSPFAGGGGGVGGVGGSGSTGGAGGFGGGGGGGTFGGNGGFGGGGGGNAATGGAGGFGGGGGGGGDGAGAGGFGGGGGEGVLGSSAAGGGGLGAGGAIFVQEGGTLTVAGALTVNGNNVTGGTAGGGAAAAGSALGSGMFLQGNGTVTFAPGAGQSQTVANVIADQTGSGGSGVNAGSYSLSKTGAGTLTLSGDNTYTGGTTVSGGTLQLSGAGTLGGPAAATTVSGGTLDLGGTSQTQNGGVGLTGGTIQNGTLSSSGSFALQAGTVSAVLAGSGSLAKTGSGTVALTGNNTYQGGTTINNGLINFSNANNFGSGQITLNGGGLQWATGNTTDISNRLGALGALGGGFDTNGNDVTLASDLSGAGAVFKSGLGTLTLGGTNTFAALVVTGGAVSVSADANLGSGPLALVGGTLQTTGTFTLSRTTSLVGNGTFDTAFGTTLTHAGTIEQTGGLTKTGAGTLVLGGANTYQGGTAINGGTLAVAADNNLGNAAGGLSFNGGTLQTTASLSTSRTATLNGGGGTFDVAAGTLTYNGAIGGTGSLTKAGAGILTLTGNNTYGGGTFVNAGSLTIDSGSISGPVSVTGPTTFLVFQSTGSAANAIITTSAGNFGNGGVIFSGNSTAANASITVNADSGVAFRDSSTAGNATVTINGSDAAGGFTNTATGGTSRWINAGGTFDISGVTAGGVSIGSLAGAGLFSLGSQQLTVGGNNLSTTISGVIADGGFSSGTGGSLVKEGTGTLTLSGNNTFTGGTTVNAGMLVVNGSLASPVTVNAGGMLGGSGTLGGLAVAGGIVGPGNSIGTLTINGNFSQNGGVYQVEANAAGQSDRIVATGTATIGGGATVQVLAQTGNYATSTTYTILTANGSVSGTYSGVTSNFAFLTPSLSYDANNVFLTLALQGNAFSGFGGNTPNQRSVGYALDQSYANASGDFATVIGALANLSTTQAGPALDAISGQQYADFGTANVNTSALFMNTLGQQMALARGAAAGGQRVALAMACEVETCDTARPLSAWFSGLGGLGSVQGDGNASTLTYNFGGAAAGIDYRFTPNILLGLGVGYTHGTQWVNSFMGQGWSDSISVAAYGSFTQAGFYADALAGYAYFNNQMQRQIQIPGLQPRTATGSTGANQFLTQVETGYGLPVFGEKLTATPFARLQFSTTTQNGFNESGANSLSLSVVQQTTNSLRTVFGAELASNLPLGSQRQLGLALRLGWQHEYADTGRPITAAFSGAPSASFTVYGAIPTRDAAIVGFSANTTIAQSTQLYARYDGTLASGTDNHAFTAGLRLSW